MKRPATAFQRKQHFELSSSVVIKEKFRPVLIATHAKNNAFIWIFERIFYVMACSLLAEKSKWNLRSTCTISHTSRHTTRLIHGKLSKSTICTLLGKRDDCHVWVGKLLLVCAHRDFIDKCLEKRNYGSI